MKRKHRICVVSFRLEIIPPKGRIEHKVYDDKNNSFRPLL